MLHSPLTLQASYFASRHCTFNVRMHLPSKHAQDTVVQIRTLTLFMVHNLPQGACNAIFSLPDNVAAKGVATHSSGNHAGAVAKAAQVTCNRVLSHAWMLKVRALQPLSLYVKAS